MKKLQFFVCENMYPEYQRALMKLGLIDVEMISFSPLCLDKRRKKEVEETILQAEDQSFVICNTACDILKLIPDKKHVKTVTRNYCFSHIICDGVLEYLISQGSYIINSGWLKEWRKNIADMGFDRETAKEFFHESNKQIVLLDSKIDENSAAKIEEMSSYLELPYVIIPTELDGIVLMLKSLIYEWRLHNLKKDSLSEINELRKQTADYSAIFDMIGKISNYTNKRDVIDKIQELFIVIFGAQNFKFWSNEADIVSDEVKNLQASEDHFLFLKEQNKFYIKIEWEDKCFGTIEASGFMFPQYIQKYLNLAIEICRFSGLVLQNNEQYEKILASEKELEYMSFHDSMTGLYNRAYINRILSKGVDDNRIIVFMFDIDKLKYVNDNFGHDEGDRLINSFAEILTKCIRETDTVARIGGDEFIVILYNADEETAKELKQRINDNILINNENLTKKYLKLSVSIGYAMRSNEKESFEDLMKKADELMYEEKMAKRQKN